METVTNPRFEAIKKAKNRVPAPVDEVDEGGPLASEVYENVPVLGDLTEEKFLRLMTAITEWVSPEQGCAYCHNEEDLADESPYTKEVSRRMLQMTADINKDWQDHVVTTGVTCYTCHRGQPVPSEIWFKDSGPVAALGRMGNRFGQNHPTVDNAYSSLPYDPFSDYMKGDKSIRVIPTTALPTGANPSIHDTEETYALMMHVSGSLGVNCTFCHNTRSFFDWDQSTPQRLVAWHGFNMVRELNVSYMEPLTSAFPPNRLGPQGDVAKVNCATCHHGVNKPLYGANMLKDYPELDAAK